MIRIITHSKPWSSSNVAVSNPSIGNQVRHPSNRKFEFLLSLIVGDGWRCQGVESNTKFEQIDLSENKEWMDYDEKAKQAVAINEIEFKFVKVK